MRFYALTIVLVTMLAELSAQIVYFVGYSERYTPRGLVTLAGSREPPAPIELVSRGEGRRSDDDVLHPFLGHVRTMQRRDSASHGFPHALEPIRQRRPDRLLIGVFGGSVADELASYIEDAFAGGPVQPVVIDLAIGGYKQPQQLMALAYLISLGAEFDLVLNIDGFNELTISIDENRSHGVYPHFPRGWGARVGREQGAANLVLAGKIGYLLDREHALYDKIEASLFRRSAIYGLFRRYQLARATDEIHRAHARLLGMQETGYDFERNGPDRRYASRDALIGELVAGWSASSASMYALATSGGAEYYHFLQPNLYLPGSKPLTDEERSPADDSRRAYSEIVSTGYPRLTVAGLLLTDRGIPFHDASLIFSERPETIYRDACCHYNELGNRIFAEFVRDRVLEKTGLPGLANGTAPATVP